MGVPAPILGCRFPVLSFLCVLRLGMAGISSVSHEIWWSWTRGGCGCGDMEQQGSLEEAGSSSGVARSVEDVICGLVRHCWRWTQQEACGGLAQGDSYVLPEPVSIKASTAMELKRANTRAQGQGHILYQEPI